ncbi:DctP family TRAP transporter solute-binding subunit [Candidatus Latescibacterota bacterium]
MKTKLTVILSIAVLLILSCGNADNTSKTLNFSLILGENSDWYKGAKRFVELIESKTAGQYKIKIFPHAQLAGQDQRTELEMVQSGVIDMSFESTILLSLIEPRMSVLSLPWMFNNYEQAGSVLDGPLGKEMLAMLPAKGIVGLAYGVNGFRQLTNSQRAISAPEDLTALKIRIPSIKMYIDIFKLLGADPSSMSFGEVFTALAQGTFDGQENPVSVINSARLYEVQKYLTVWNYSYDPIIICVNNRLWDSFSPETQAIFAECADEAMRYQRDVVSQGETALLDSLRQKGMEITVLDSDSLKPFKALAEPVYTEYSDEIGTDLIERFRRGSID